MPQCHIQKHPQLKQFILTNQMKNLIGANRIRTSFAKAKRLAEVMNKTLATVVSSQSSPEEKEAIRVRFFVSPRQHPAVVL